MLSGDGDDTGDAVGDGRAITVRSGAGGGVLSALIGATEVQPVRRSAIVKSAP